MSKLLTAHNTCHDRRKSAYYTPAKRFLTAIPMADEKMAEFLNMSKFINSNFINIYSHTNNSDILERRNSENIGKHSSI